MLTPKARQWIETFCQNADKDALAEVMQIVKAAYATKTRVELQKWYKGQRVSIQVGNNGGVHQWVEGTVQSVNKNTLTIESSGRKYRCSPSMVKHAK